VSKEKHVFLTAGAKKLDYIFVTILIKTLKKLHLIFVTILIKALIKNLKKTLKTLDIFL
jgi:hypothetical protein